MSEINELAKKCMKLTLEIKEINDALKPKREALKDLKAKLSEMMKDGEKKEIELADGVIRLQSKETPETINKKVIAEALVDCFTPEDIEKVTSNVMTKRPKKTKTDITIKPSA